MHLGANFDQQTAKIREFSLNCLQNINDVMYFDEQKELNNKKEYIKHSIESIACVGGNEEENVGIFCNTISSIGGYFSYLMVHSEQFPHASKILIEIENDLEEYGGQEEINCQQYTQEWQHNNFVSHSSIFSMRDILNVHKHISNEKSREQIDDEFEEDRNVRAVQELLEQEEDDASNEDGEFSNEEDDASIEEEVESIIIKK
ncbi:MAG: hypothetical protein EZS28_016687 [Streblomastix strix]|uniref:Uncharacterized protein n=1 Tax=Streblomastix strix TaxID=222440 RepID=A0A5J4VYP1_9EUKA|nr:MAG: hypothetical protein EZS28_016687 [Streblomastix strix]